MKIKTRDISLSRFSLIRPYPHKKPRRPSRLLATLVRFLSKKETGKVHFAYEDSSSIPPSEPALILMNHSSFLDLEIAFTIFRKRRLNIVATDDGFIGKEGLMRSLGAIPTKKFVFDLDIVSDIRYCLRSLHTSVLLYPEATYSFDGRSALLPESIGKLIKYLGVPVISVITSGSFLRDPLYNGLQLREVDVRAEVKTLFGSEETQSLSAEKINERVRETFSFDAFDEQRRRGIRIDEPFRCDKLNRVLYRSPPLSGGRRHGRQGDDLVLPWLRAALRIGRIRIAA